MHPFLDSLKAGWSRSMATNSDLIAAGIAYYAFLSLVPLLAAAILTYGLVVDPATIADHANGLISTLPGISGEFLASQLADVAAQRSNSSGLGLVVAIALALFGARVAAGALIAAIDMAFAEPKPRGFISANLLALAITLGAAVSLGLMGGLTTLVATVLAGTGGAYASYIAMGLAGFAGAYLAYRVIPQHTVVSRSAAVRGSGLFAVGWLAVSTGFGFYVSNLTNYNATYGSLGAIIVFLTWIWLSAFLLLLGAHFAAASPQRRG